MDILETANAMELLAINTVVKVGDKTYIRIKEEDDSGKVLINNCWFENPGKGEQFRLECEGKTLAEIRAYAKDRQKDRDVTGLKLHDNDYSK